MKSTVSRGRGIRLNSGMRIGEILTDSTVPGPLAALLPHLDHLLTGRPETETARTAAAQRYLLDPEAFLTMSDAYYLSDGGYSRVKADGETGRLVLSGVSRKAVVARWHDHAVRQVIDQIEDHLRDCLRDAGLL